MDGKIYRYMADDHARLDRLLERAVSRPDKIEASAYAEFRAGLLKHIAMEEKILLPAVQRVRDGKPLPIAAKLKLDHGALAALLVPTPRPEIVAAIRTILKDHNSLRIMRGNQCSDDRGGLLCEDGTPPPSHSFATAAR